MSQFVTNRKSIYPALSPSLPGRSLAGKTVFITGASRGVGKHLVRGFAAANASRIGLLGRDKARVEAARTEFSTAYPKTEFTAYAADITNEDAIATVFKDFGAPDILVNNAGIFPDDGPFINQDLKAWFAGFETNILGTAVVTQKYLQARAAASKPGGIIINVSSFAAHMRFPLSGWSGYTSSKLGQMRIFEYLRFEHPDVRFINMHPGSVESDGYAKSGATEPPGGMTDGEVPAAFAAWLATDEADFLSGRFVWAEWDVEELKAKKDEILEKDLLLSTIDGLVKGF